MWFSGWSSEGPFDALLIPEGGARLHAIAPLLALYKIDTTKRKILGSALWTDPTLATEPTLTGAWSPPRRRAPGRAFA